MNKPYTLWEIYQFSKEALIAAGLEEYQIMFPVFMEAVREIIDEYSFLEGKLRLFYTFTGSELDSDGALGVTNVKEIQDAYIDTYRISVVTYDVFNQNKQEETLGTTDYMAWVDIVNGKIYFENVDSDDEVTMTLLFNLDDVNEDVAKSSCPDINFRVFKWGTISLIKQANNIKFANDERLYRKALMQDVHRTRSGRVYPGIVIKNYLD